MVGDIHGTNEIPAAFGEYVCAAAATYGGKTMVALELGSSQADRVQAALRSEEDARTALADTAFRSGHRDGRVTEAILELLVRLGELKELGMDIEVVPYQSVSAATADAFRRGENPQPFLEKDYADVVLAAAQGADRTIVMSGSIHAMKAPGNPAFVTFDPMASHFPDGTISMLVLHDGGTRWGLTGGESKEHTVSPSSQPKVQDYPQFVFDSSLDPQFDGYLTVGLITAAHPPQKDPAD